MYQCKAGTIYQCWHYLSFQTLETHELAMLIETADENCHLRFTDVVKVIKMERNNEAYERLENYRERWGMIGTLVGRHQCVQMVRTFFTIWQ